MARLDIWVTNVRGVVYSRKMDGFDEARIECLEALALLPDEAFAFVLGTIVNVSSTAGGFQADSRKALELAGPKAESYLTKKQT